jgi:integrase
MFTNAPAAAGLENVALGLSKIAAKAKQQPPNQGAELVFSEPKTERSRRTVPLSPAVVAMLRKHKPSQAAEKLRAANQWQDWGLVFTTGGPVDPRNFLRVMEVAAKAAGVECDDVHTLRR